MHRSTAEFDQFPRHIITRLWNDFHRQREFAQSAHEFALVGDADERVGDCSDDFLPGQGRAAAFDQGELRINFIRAIHIKRQGLHLVQIQYLYTVLLKALAGGVGTCHRSSKPVFVCRQ